MLSKEIKQNYLENAKDLRAIPYVNLLSNWVTILEEKNVFFKVHFQYKWAPQ